jgi:hypothetical protein
MPTLRPQVKPLLADGGKGEGGLRWGMLQGDFNDANVVLSPDLKQVAPLAHASHCQYANFLSNQPPPFPLM